jgi:hypothetical protein
MTAGYARIETDSGSSDLAGVAIFSSHSPDGVLMSEASVPVSPLVQSGRLYVEVKGAANTGVAFANPADQETTIYYSFTDTFGRNVGSGNFKLGAGRQLAAFLNEPPFNLPTSLEGSFAFTSSNGISAIALRGFTNERQEFLMTTLPIVGETEPSTTALLPHFAVGGGWTTRLILVNPTSAVLTGRAELMDPGSETLISSPLRLSVNTSQVSSFLYSIPPRGVSSVTLKSIDGEVKTGSVRLTSTNKTVAPSGLAIFSYTEGDITVSEASVPIESPSSAFRMYVDSRGAAGTPGSFQTGFALANTAPYPIVADLELSRIDGTATGLTGTVTIPGNGQIARFLNEVIPNVPDTFRGVLRVTSATPISVIGLRLTTNERGDYLMTTTPPASETTDSAIREWTFPHIVEGGGFTTEVVLFNRHPGQSSTGNATFFAKDGSPLLLH